MSDVFVPVRLYTQAGDFVVEGEIPSFNKAPDVLIWGERFFRHSHKSSGPAPYYVAYYVYEEAFTVALVRIK